MDEAKTSRRGLIKLGASAFAVGTLGGLGKSVASQCGLTPKQPEGPFYPVTQGVDEDNDLTFVIGNTQKAEGEVIVVEGTVADEACKPLEGALVEIWQANKHGRYNHPSDPNINMPLDPNFQYWGQAVTDKNGNYRFKTIYPGAYPADVNWIRPPHIHFRIEKLGYLELITQLYFSDQPELNKKDLILKAVPATERKKVVATLTVGMDPGIIGLRKGRFDITLRKPKP